MRKLRTTPTNTLLVLAAMAAALAPLLPVFAVGRVRQATRSLLR